MLNDLARLNDGAPVEMIGSLVRLARLLPEGSIPISQSVFQRLVSAELSIHDQLWADVEAQLRQQGVRTAEETEKIRSKSITFPQLEKLFNGVRILCAMEMLRHGSESVQTWAKALWPVDS